MILSFQKWLEWSTLLANVSTIIGVVGIIVIIISIYKNRLTKKTFECNCKILKTEKTEDSYFVYIDLKLLNFTEKDFFISAITFFYKNQSFILKEFYSPYLNGLMYTRDIKDISVSSHESKTISGHIELPLTEEKNCCLYVELKTTEKTLIYNYPFEKKTLIT